MPFSFLPRRFAARIRRHRHSPTPVVDQLELRTLLAGVTALPDTLMTQADAPASIQVLLNDSDVDGDELSIDSFTHGSSGAVTHGGDGTLIYTPTSSFSGFDTFTYVATDGNGNQDTGVVEVAVNMSIDGDAARDTILNGVSTLTDPVQPGHAVVYGPTAFSISNYPGSDLSDPMIAAASLGSGRVVALPDHQWLNLSSHGSDADMSNLYQNSIEWLADSGSQNVSIVTYNNQSNADWLDARGFTDVTNATSATLASDLVGADVFVAGWMGSNPSGTVLDTVETFVGDGGGLLIADYGIGYQWWWGKATEDIPLNQLLRKAGIAVTKDWPHSGAQAVNRGVGQMTDRDMISLLIDSGGASAAEKNQAAAIYSRMNGVLAEDDSLQAELDAVFWARINTISPTPATPVTDVFEQALLGREMDLIGNLPPDEVTAHRTANDVYGAIPAGAERVTDAVVTLDTSITGMHATGLYAAPGELVTVTVPSSLVGEGYTLRISGHVDNISGRSSWDRVPRNVARNYPLDTAQVEIAGAFGGAIYVDFGGQAAGETPGLGNIEITIDGAVRAPLYILGETTDGDWNNGIRDLPGPYAEFVSNGVAMSVPSAWIRDLSTPTELMTYWNDVATFQDWVGGFENLRTGPDRFNVDVQISVGLLHAGYPIQGPTWASGGLVDLPQLWATGNWGYFHELGHEMQRHPELDWGYNNPYTFDGDIEVTVNIFANAALELQVPDSPTGGWGWGVHPDEVMTRARATIEDSANPSFEDKNPYPFYFQLADGEWGWQGYRDVLSTYVDQQLNDPGSLPQNNQEEKDEWLIRWSAATGYDLTRYMVDNWQLEVTQAALDSVAAMSLPDWMPLANGLGTIAVPRGSEVIIDLANGGSSLDDVATLVSFQQPAAGSLIDNGDGTVMYQPPPLFTGRDSFLVTYRSSAGNEQTFEVPVNVQLNGVLMERFDGIPGNAVSDLTGHSSYPDNPTLTEFQDHFETPTDAGSNFGVRTRAYLLPPTTGDYTFWIASDDEGSLLLSTDTESENASEIASVPGWTSPRQWTKFPEQQSATVSLVAGERYYIEALMKEGGGGDNLAIAWQGAGISGPTVIDNQYLHVFGVEYEEHCAYVDDSVLNVCGTADDDVISIRVNSPQTTVTIGLSDGTDLQFSFDTSLVTGINVAAGGGDDRVSILGTQTRPTTLHGGAGDDSLAGGFGPDTIFGGPGNDRLKLRDGGGLVDGEAGNDQLFDGPDDDTLRGGPGHDTLLAEDGDDDLDGGPDDDSLKDLSGNNTLSGGDGDDTLTGGTGDDTIDAGPGNDRVFERSGTNLINGNAGNDTMTGGSGADTLRGHEGDDRLFDVSGTSYQEGGPGNDRLTGGTGDDLLLGGDDSDTLIGGRGVDTLRGEAGDDELVDTIEASLQEGGDGNDSLRGGRFDDTLLGGPGNDFMLGGTGNDLLDGETGDDSLTGGPGDDTLLGRDGNDRLLGIRGANLIDAGGGDDLITGGTDDDFAIGGPGNDTVRGGRGDDTLTGDAGDDEVAGGDGHDLADGGDGNDSLEGETGNDTLRGGAGNDRVVGTRGRNLVDGDDGNDVVNGGANASVILGGDGDDTIRGAQANDILVGGAGTDLVDGHSGWDIVIGGTTNLSDADLFLVLDEWTSNHSYADRTANIRYGGGSVSGNNGSAFLDNGTHGGAQTVFDDGGTADTLRGRTGTDWFFGALSDLLADRAPNELFDVL